MHISHYELPAFYKRAAEQEAVKCGTFEYSGLQILGGIRGIHNSIKAAVYALLEWTMLDGATISYILATSAYLEVRGDVRSALDDGLFSSTVGVLFTVTATHVGTNEWVVRIHFNHIDKGHSAVLINVSQDLLTTMAEFNVFMSQYDEDLIVESVDKSNKVDDDLPL